MINKLLILISLLLFCATSANAQKVKILGIAGQSNTVVTSGVSSSTKAFRTLPGCTVTILNADGTNATIFSDAVGSSKSNPYVSSSTDATYDFFITPGASFSVRFSGLGVSSAFTRSGYVAPGVPGFSLPLCAGSNDTAILSAANTAGGTIEIPNGVTCASNSLSISAALQIDKGGLLKPLTGQTITLTGPQNDAAWTKFTNATAGLGTITFAGNKAVATVYPEWWGPAKDGVTNDSAPFTAFLAALKTMNGVKGFITPRSTYLFNTGFSLDQFSAVKITSDENCQNFRSQCPTFLWNGTGGIMFDLNRSQTTYIEGIYFKVNTAKSIDSFIRIDQTGSGQISHRNFVRYNAFDAGVQANATAKLISLGPIGLSNNEYMTVAFNDFVCSSTSGASALGTGIDVGNSSNQKFDYFGYNGFQQCAIGIKTQPSATIDHNAFGTSALGVYLGNGSGEPDYVIANDFESVVQAIFIDNSNGPTYVVANRLTATSLVAPKGVVEVGASAGDIYLQSNNFQEGGLPAGAWFIDGSAANNAHIISSHNRYPSSTVAIAFHGFNPGGLDPLPIQSRDDRGIADAPAVNFMVGQNFSISTARSTGGSDTPPALSATVIATNGNPTNGAIAVQATHNWNNGSSDGTMQSVGVDARQTGSIGDEAAYRAFRANVPVSAGTLLNYYGFYNKANTSGTVITNGYGLYLEDLATSTGITNKRGIFQAGAGDVNHLAGLLSQGQGATLSITTNTIAPTNSIHLVGTGLIKTITKPSLMTAGVIYLIAGGTPFTMDNSANVATPVTTPAANDLVICVYSTSDSKWHCK